VLFSEISEISEFRYISRKLISSFFCHRRILIMAGRYVSGDNKSDESASPSIVRSFYYYQRMYIRQEKVASMKQEDISIAAAIVSIFETGKPNGNYGALVVLNDGAGVSYGIKQFTHRSGSLLQVVEKYLLTDATAGREKLLSRLPILRRSTKPAIDTLARDQEFKEALKDAAATNEMRAAQDAVATGRYMKAAIDECRAMGLKLPLSLAVVYDSIVHGSWRSLAEQLGPVRDEKRWIERYVEHRHEWLRSIARLRVTTYRTDFFLKEIARGNWQLELPLNVHGYTLISSDLQPPATTAAAVSPENPPGPDPKGRDVQVAAPTIIETVDRIEKRVNAVAARVDQAERILVTTSTRTDKAKSLWATVAGTIWQMVWAICGFFAGVPREVWLVVAIIAGVLVALFIYRQITLGMLRENHSSEFHL
jgi:chitosanase